MGQVRITGGIHRSRKIPVADQPGLRPTSDRLREVLFNWLGNNLSGMRVLDLYAGTGILSLEAASRGAASITLIDNNRQVVSQLQNTIRLLQAEQATVRQQAAEDFVRTSDETFDLIFLDPPFDSDEMDRISVIIEPLTRLGTLLYREYGQSQQFNALNEDHWTLKKHKTMGQVQAELWEKI
jgi:16S rRNA (guanine(966)-N(2))-methyltransferase RsmD